MKQFEEKIPEYWKNLSLENIIYLDDKGKECVEEWRDIVGYEGQYQISNLGRLKSLGRKQFRKDKYGNDSYISVSEKIKKQWLRGDGYFSCSLKDYGYVKIHRAVAAAFIDNPENKPTVNHKKGIRIDNRHFMLEWATYSEQNFHAMRELGKKNPMTGKKGKLCHFSVPIICINDGIKYDSMTEAGAVYGVKSGHISRVIRHPLKFKSAKGYVFKLATL